MVIMFWSLLIIAIALVVFALFLTTKEPTQKNYSILCWSFLLALCSFVGFFIVGLNNHTLVSDVEYVRSKNGTVFIVESETTLITRVDVYKSPDKVVVAKNLFGGLTFRMP